MQIGVVVNPFAGLGGAVGLKGTDGPDTVAQALRRGAVAKAGWRARAALSHLATRVPGAKLTLAPGALGQKWAKGLDLDVTVIGVAGRTRTARDTKEAVAAMGGLEVVVFAGGDGTARDVAAVTGEWEAAILGIPCGVKMHSGVFAVTPKSAGAMIANLLAAPERVTWVDDAEIMDIDEEALRQGILAPRLYGLARVPVSCNLMQTAKGGPRDDAAASLIGAARQLADAMDDETLYVIGPGTSAASVATVLGETATPLGVDAMLAKRIIARDTDESTLLQLARGRAVRVILGVTGRQGFLLGRGNQQIGPHLIRRAGRNGLLILASQDKLMTLQQPRLLVDTGEPGLDQRLQGFVRVLTGRNREMIMRIASC